MTKGRLALACGVLVGASLLAPVRAQDIGSGPLQDLTNWIVRTYDEFRERARTSEQADADAAMLKEREAAEKEAVAHCRNAINLKAQHMCIAARSDAFEQARGRRFAPGEARFKVLAYLEQQLNAAPAPPSKPNLQIERVAKRCDALPEPQRGNCQTRYRDCLVLHQQSVANGRQCLKQLEGIIDESDKARRAGTPAVTGRPGEASVPPRIGKDPSCLIFDDAAKSADFSERDPVAHAALLRACV